MSNKRAALEAKSPALARIFHELDSITDVQDVDALAEECRKKAKAITSNAQFQALLRRAALPKEVEHLVTLLEREPRRDGMRNLTLMLEIKMMIGGLRVDAVVVTEHGAFGKRMTEGVAVRFSTHGNVFYTACTRGNNDQSPWQYDMLPATKLDPSAVADRLEAATGLSLSALESISFDYTKLPWIKKRQPEPKPRPGAIVLGMIVYIIERMSIQKNTDTMIPSSVELDLSALSCKMHAEVCYAEAEETKAEQREQDDGEAMLRELARLTSIPCHICV